MVNINIKELLFIINVNYTEKNPIKNLDGDIQKRLQYFEGREDLFETKILRMSKKDGAEEPSEHKILAVSRNPGSAKTLAPVMEILNQEEDCEIIAITDGKAQENLEKEFEMENISPANMVLEADKAMGHLDAILLDSSWSNPGIDFYATATYKDVPLILIEGMHTSNDNYLKWAKEKGMRLPEKICVIDEYSKELLLRKFPDLGDRVEVTGQPAFDKFGSEEDKNFCEQARKNIGLKDSDKLVTFMATSDMTSEMVQAVAIDLKKMPGDFYFCFCKHPRDTKSYKVYNDFFNKEGIKIINAEEHPNEQLSAAADVVITTWSTEGLHAIYRRKPLLYIADLGLLKVPPTLDLTPPLPPVRLGASAGIDNINKLSETLRELINPESDLNKQLKENMEKFYPRDGKNAHRVAEVINKILKSK